MTSGAHDLVGREEALATLTAALERATAGRGALAYVSGDPGIGKSALVTVLATLAEARGCVVTTGRAWEFAGAPAYFPVRACLRSIGLDTDAPVYQGVNAFRLWEDVVAALAHASATKPAVWIVEDIHAADHLTLDLLSFVAHAVRALRVLVVATARPRDPRTDEQVAARLVRLGRDALDVRLEPLRPEEVAQLAQRWASREMSTEGVAELVDLTGGNPLFVVECARALRAGGRGKALPPTVRQIVLDRLAALPEATRRALACGAVLGREFTAAVVGRMEGMLPARVIDAVLPALRAGIVTDTDLGRFAFSHAIVRDVVEDELSGPLRADLHRRAETALAAEGSSAEIVVERARHALAAATLGDGAHARELAKRAAELLEGQGAYDRAHAVYERLAAGATPEERLHHAEVASAAGQASATRRICAEVVESARRTNDARLVARSALLYGAHLRPAVVDDTLVNLLRESLAMLGDADERLACKLLARLAAALQPAADPDVPMAMAREAIVRARALDDASLLLEVMDNAASALVDFAPVAERLGVYAEILELSIARGDRERALRAYHRSALDHVYVGDFEGFDRDVDHALALAAALGHPRFRWRTLLLASMRALSRGDLETSERCLVEVRELAVVTDDPALPLSLVAHACNRAILLHDEAELRETLATLEERMLGVPHRVVIAAVYRAAIHARLEEPARVAEELVKARPALAVFEREPAAAAVLVEAYASAGTEEQRRRMRALLEPEIDREAQAGHVPVTYDGPVRRGAALLDSELGDHAGAEANLAIAITRAVERGHRPWVAQLLYDRARARRRAGRTAEALADARESAAVAEELGIVGLARRARDLAGGPVAPPAVARSTAPRTRTFTMTREGDLWALAAGERLVRVRDTRGIQLLARLVERADEEIHVLALASDEAGSLVDAPAGDLLDDRARRAYKSRLRELAAEIEDAERCADAGRLERCRRESAMLEKELTRATRLGGSARATATASERARINVQRRIKDAVARVAEVDAELGAYLARAVRTGTFCCFRP